MNIDGPSDVGGTFSWVWNKFSACMVVLAEECGWKESKEGEVTRERKYVGIIFINNFLALSSGCPMTHTNAQNTF